MGNGVSFRDDEKVPRLVSESDLNILKTTALYTAVR